MFGNKTPPRATIENYPNLGSTNKCNNLRPYTHHAKIDAYAYATQRPAEYRKTQTYERKSERAEQRETIAPTSNYIRMEKTSSVQTTIGKDKTTMVERNEI